MKCTHVVVSVPDYESDKLDRAKILRKLDGLTVVVFCGNASDADVCRKAFQEVKQHHDLVYAVVELEAPKRFLPF
jgi:hypothetical protein